MPNHPVALELLKNIDFPLAAPSANPFGYISPTNSQHVQNQIGEKIEYILEGGACQKGVESTIIGFENNEAVLYRLGAITIEEIEKVIGKITLANKETNTPKASGMLPYHYAPLTPFVLCENILLEIKKHLGKKIGIISFSNIEKTENIAEIVVLSNDNKLEEAAKNLYSALHYLDSKKLDIIIAQKFEEKGLGKTLNDRLTKASKR
jgi:L-threonylcarbamoyladenylate synthase